MKATLILVPAFLLITAASSKPAAPQASLSAPADSTVTAIAVGEKYIWIGTRHGLYKINRSNGKTGCYTSANSKLPSDNISSLALEPDGNLWVGTGNGIMRFDNYSFYVLTPENSRIPDYNISSIAVDRDGNVWLGSANAGITVIRRTNSKIHFRVSNSVLLSDSIGKLVARANGSMLVKFANDSCRIMQLTNEGLISSEVSTQSLITCFCGLNVASSRGDLLLSSNISGKVCQKDKLSNFALKAISGFRFPQTHAGSDSLNYMYFNALKSELSRYLAFGNGGMVLIAAND